MLPNRTALLTMSLVLGAFSAAKGDLIVSDISGKAGKVLKVTEDANRVALSFTTTATNRGDPVRWGFPVRERLLDDAGKEIQWFKDNKTFIMNNAGDRDRFPAGGEPVMGFSAFSEGYNHEHIRNLAAAPPSTRDSYGSHPHIQLFVFCQPGGLFNPAAPLVLLGTSQLKHTFATVDPDHHFLLDSETDSYSFRSNRDRDFFGPVFASLANPNDGIDPFTFLVADHDHLGSFARVDNAGMATEFRVYDRDHGEKDHADPFEHLLQVNKENLDPNKALPGTKWFVAASYFVSGEPVADRGNNTFYRRFDPVTLDLLAETRNGAFLPPMEQFVAGPGACVPEPSAVVLTAIGGSCIFASLAVRRRRFLHLQDRGA